jgi:predicted DNA-binding transcriptional regulator YafY
MKGLLMRAAESGERLEMIYQSNKGDLTQRIIKVEKVGKDSFKAYCYTRMQLRTFKLNNVLSIGPIRKHYNRGA